jgi:hypothetical protein
MTRHDCWSPWAAVETSGGNADKPASRRAPSRPCAVPVEGDFVSVVSCAREQFAWSSFSVVPLQPPHFLFQNPQETTETNISLPWDARPQHVPRHSIGPSIQDGSRVQEFRSRGFPTGLCPIADRHDRKSRIRYRRSKSMRTFGRPHSAPHPRPACAKVLHLLIPTFATAVISVVPSIAV